MPRQATDLGHGVRVYQAPLWQTNCLLAQAEGEVLLADPSLSTEDIEGLAADAAAAAHVYVLVTHADYDHVCGLAAFPGATVVGAPDTGARIADGSAAQGLVAAGEEWGWAWQAAGLRVDRELRPGEEAALGPFRVAALDAPSHGRDGIAFVLLGQGVLFAGDHVSPITIPLVAASLARTIDATRALLEAIERHDLRHVVPGHGPVLDPAQARAVGEADLAYLEALRDAAADARGRGLSSGWALLRAFAVEPPRADTDDFAVYGIRAGNARQALAEAA
jgi:glyoxylase-like metal-dependent hydrolase (beta-lactamase superfamily II)